MLNLIHRLLGIDVLKAENERLRVDLDTALHDVTVLRLWRVAVQSKNPGLGNLLPEQEHLDYAERRDH
ncbi:hypothetical protein GCM10009793_08770 [Brachybacterium phenoliresistens]|uniref:Uncharacterized protein n=2 Tax=Brachybacterium phenoliresistens TaxID=396014 RepID=Z9JTZ1_9MICO|nr:hypothetical protein BF93_17785 [Brachybacterium phenoliresistens]